MAPASPPSSGLPTPARPTSPSSGCLRIPRALSGCHCGCSPARSTTRSPTGLGRPMSPSSPARKRSSRRTRATGSRPSRPCRATSTCLSWRSTRSSSAPTWTGATSSPTACSTRGRATKLWCSALRRCGRWSKSSCRARTSSAARGSQTSVTPVKRRSPGCRAARRSSPSRRKRSTPSPN